MSSSKCPLSVGQVVECFYPAHNQRGVSPMVFERRQFVVRHIRDCEEDPVQESTISQRPDVLRGRYLLTVQDANKHDWRSFYYESMWRPEESRVPIYQIATYDPVDEKPEYDCVGALFTAADRSCFKKLIDDVNQSLNQRQVIRGVALLQINGQQMSEVSSTPRCT